MKLKKNRKSVKTKRIYIIIVIFLGLILTFIKITKNVSVFFMNYAEAEILKLTSNVINSSVSMETLDLLDTSSLYLISKNSNNEIEMVDYNSNMVNKFLDDVTNEIQNNLLKLDNGNLELNKEIKSNSGVVFTIPFGIIFNNPILNNIGPQIPVKMKTIGALSTNVIVRVKEYGINNAFIEMVVFIEVKEQIILPLITKEITVTNEVPISYKLINGKIPDYYGSSGINKSSNIFSIPLE